MTLVGEGLKVYKCKDESWCPGGAPGSCAENRDISVIGCSKCEADKYTSDDGSCHTCEKHAVAVLVVTSGIIALLVLAMFGWIVNRNQLNQSNAMLMVVISLGLTVTAIQTIGVFTNISVTWEEPLISLFKVLALVSFDLQLLKVECLVGQHSVRNLVIRQLIAPSAACYIAGIVLFKKRFFDPGLDLRIQVMNSVGAIFQMFFVAIFLSALTPLICYKHPNNLGYSMSSDPSVLCNEEGEHLSLVMVSITAVVTIILPYLATACMATVRYRSVMGNSVLSHKHLQMYRYLFFRYTPSMYWYGSMTLFRSVCVCLVPVVFRDVPSLQILSITIVLVFFATVQMHFKPWRGTWANTVDSTSNMLLVLLIVCVAMTTNFEDSTSLLGIVAVVLLSGAFLVIVVLLGYNLVRHLRPAPFYANFICHHKAQAAAQARYLQILLTQQCHEPCFLDSDHLTNLQDLFDVVRSQCRQLCVYLTADTLRRPWCAGEITIAWQNHQRVAVVIHPSFSPLSAEHLKAENIPSLLASADFQLVEYGLTDDYIAQAYRWLMLDLKTTFTMPNIEGGRQRFEEVAHWLARKRFGQSSKSSAILSKPNSVVVSCLPHDDEATASAAILAGLIQEKVLDIAPAGVLFLADLPPLTEDGQAQQQVQQCVQSAHAVIVVLSPGSLESLSQLQVIVDAIGEEVTCIPVNTPNFRFPGPDFFDEEMPKLLGEQQAALVTERLRRFFKSITIAFTTYASQQVLAVQAQAAVQRIPRSKATATAAVTTKESNGGRVSENPSIPLKLVRNPSSSTADTGVGKPTLSGASGEFYSGKEDACVRVCYTMAC